MLSQTISGRFLVFQAAIALVIARLLVDHVRLSRWSSSLGRPAGNAGRQPEQPDRAVYRPDYAAVAGAVARGVERAARRVPFETKCFPRAMAVQWLLGMRRIPSTLVVALHLLDRSGDNGYHAWVEHAGNIIIGHCDRTQYRPIMVMAREWDTRGLRRADAR